MNAINKLQVCKAGCNRIAVISWRENDILSLVSASTWIYMQQGGSVVHPEFQKCLGWKMGNIVS